LRHVSFFAVIILTAFSFYSVSAQQNGQSISLPVQYADTTNTNDLQTVSQFMHLSKYYLNVNTDSSLYWADRIISFALLKNNWHYLQFGLLARKNAEQSVLDVHNNKTTF